MATLDRVGIILTLGWLAGAVLIGYLEWDHAPQTWNEWGDFLSGVFAPLAFLWLVLGYRQQGVELRLSTEALRLQATELQHSVEEQRQLVEATRSQFETERAALAYEQQRRRAAAKPRFVIDLCSAGENDGVVTCALKVTNVGNAASSVTFRVNPVDRVITPRPASFLSGQARELRFTVEVREALDGVTLELAYRDADGTPGLCRTTWSLDDLGGQVNGDFDEVVTEPN